MLGIQWFLLFTIYITIYPKNLLIIRVKNFYELISIKICHNNIGDMQLIPENIQQICKKKLLILSFVKL